MVADAVGGPPKSAQVGIVQRVLISGCGFLRVSFRNAFIQARIFLVGVQVIGGLLAGGIRRVANDYVDGSVLLSLNGGVVFAEDVQVRNVAVFVDLEAVR